MDQELENRRIHWTAWDNLCFPLEEGGLGFRSFGDMATSFACKLWWQLRYNDFFWASFMQEKYIKGRNPALFS